MNLQTFIDTQEDRLALAKVLKFFLNKAHTAEQRIAIIKNSGIEEKVYQSIVMTGDTVSFSNAIIANFQDYRIAKQGDYYYPILRLLEYILVCLIWNEDDEKVLVKLIEQGRQKIKGLTVHKAIGRIESSPYLDKGDAIGTGVLIASDKLITCDHVFRKNLIQEARVRFNHTESSYNLSDDLFELDLDGIQSSSQFDYALIPIKRQPEQKPIKPVNILLNSGQNIRLIHYPNGERMKVSELGEIVKVGKDYIDHNIHTSQGSSGAPIFDQYWQFVAIHRGHPGINAGRYISPGITSGVPISSFFTEIQTYLS